MDERSWDEREWTRLVEQLRNGDCTPFLGAGACSGALPSASDLSRSWAERYGFPFDEQADLPEVMQYITIRESDPVAVKQMLARELSESDEPDVQDPAEPHRLLAQFPINVHLTTNYDDFMTRALERAGKRPVTTTCPWYRGAEADSETGLPRGYQPTTDEPLVYHLHGSFRRPASLVLTTQDHVEFVTSVGLSRGMDVHRIVPLQVLPAMTRLPLLFIGYNLRDWSFRMLFHGFVSAVATLGLRRHVSVQLTPDPEVGESDVRQRAQEYLARYFAQLNISVYWGSARDFCTELSHRLEEA